MYDFIAVCSLKAYTTFIHKDTLSPRKLSTHCTYSKFPFKAPSSLQNTTRVISRLDLAFPMFCPIWLQSIRLHALLGRVRPYKHI